MHQAMVRAGTPVPFARAASLLEDLAGVRLTAKRAERAAEASGAAAPASARERAALIAARRLVPLPPSPLPDKLYAVIDAIIALRCREASSTWEAICNSPHTQTRTA